MPHFHSKEIKIIIIVILIVFAASIAYISLPPQGEELPIIQCKIEYSSSNWTVRVTSISRILTNISTQQFSLYVKLQNNSTISIKPISSMISQQYFSGICYIDIEPLSILNIGDYFILDRILYPNNSEFYINSVDSLNVYYHGTLFN